MNEDTQLKLQAWLDGEIPAAEARAIVALVETDAGSRALVSELRQTRNALRGNEDSRALPETREFYWSKIQQQLRRLEVRPEPMRPVSVFGRWRRLLIPAGTLAALALVCLIAFHGNVVPPGSIAARSEGALADAGALTFQDQAERVTIIWLSFPAENDFGEEDAAVSL